MTQRLADYDGLRNESADDKRPTDSLGAVRRSQRFGDCWFFLVWPFVRCNHGEVWVADLGCIDRVSSGDHRLPGLVLRRASGFSRGDLRRGNEQQRAQTARIFRAFGWTILGQAALISTAVWLCIRSGANELVWPSIGLITSFHFAPLARVFHVRAYYVTAVAGSLISLAAFAGLGAAHWLAWFGGGMSAVMWLSAWYVMRNANQIAAKAAQETWSV